MNIFFIFYFYTHQKLQRLSLQPAQDIIASISSFHLNCAAAMHTPQISLNFCWYFTNIKTHTILFLNFGKFEQKYNLYYIKINALK